MGNLQAWQFTVDALLVMAVFYLCIRNAKGSPAIQSATLESSLRRLVQDAESASHALNEKLMQRQTRLEELLLDLETGEGRAAKTIRSLEDARAELESSLSKTQRLTRGLQERQDGAELPAQRAAVPATRAVETAGTASAPSAASRREQREQHPAPRVQYTEQRAQYTEQRAQYTEQRAQYTEQRDQYTEQRAQYAQPRAEYTKQRAPHQEQQEPIEHPEQRRSVRGYAAYGRTAAPQAAQPALHDEPPLPPAAPAAEENEAIEYNIYGEPIRRSASAARPAKKSLAESVEREPVSPNAGSGSEVQDELQRIYDAAESMLRNGRSLDSVAQATALPIDEVRMLSQMVAQERRLDEAPRPDPRLGALGPVRRQVQTL